MIKLKFKIITVDFNSKYCSIFGHTEQYDFFIRNASRFQTKYMFEK